MALSDADVQKQVSEHENYVNIADKLEENRHRNCSMQKWTRSQDTIFHLLTAAHDYTDRGILLL